MLRSDNDYLEEYKKTDNLCKEILSSETGVSEYIERMENSDSEGMAAVLTWEEDYHMLKHLRWVRNRIAHDNLDNQASDDRDFENLFDFHDRLLSGEDPLTILLNTQKKKEKPKKTGPKKNLAGLDADLIRPKENDDGREEKKNGNETAPQKKKTVKAESIEKDYKDDAEDGKKVSDFGLSFIYCLIAFGVIVLLYFLFNH